MTGRPTPRNQFSFSRVKTYSQCPLRYRYRYLKGLKEAFRSIETYLGNTVHDVLEWMYAQRDETVAPSVDDVLTRFADVWSKDWNDEITVIRITDDPDDYYRVGREMLTRFHRDTFGRDQSSTVALEQRFSRRLSNDVVFTGFADRVGRTSNGRLFVVDYKTSKSEGDSSEFSEGLQAPLYAVCAMERFEADEALAGYHYLRHGTTHWQVVDRDRGQQLLDRFVQLVEGARAAADYSARPSVLCAWCGFNRICPAADVPDHLAGGLRAAEAAGGPLFANDGGDPPTD